MDWHFLTYCIIIISHIYIISAHTKPSNFSIHLDQYAKLPSFVCCLVLDRWCAMCFYLLEQQQLGVEKNAVRPNQNRNITGWKN